MAVSIDPLRVFIVERALLFGEALGQVLAADASIRVVGIATDRASSTLTDAHPDVIVVDVDCEDPSRVLEHYHTVCPSARVCFLSMYGNPELMRRRLALGADGYLMKDASLRELLTAVKSVGFGAGYVDPRLATMLVRRNDPMRLSCSDRLTPRETEIIRLIAQGLSNRDIGRRLILSEKTVKNHISSIFSKRHFTARSQAAVHAIRAGLV